MYALLLSGIEETNAQQHNHRVSSKRRQYEGRRNSTKKTKTKKYSDAYRQRRDRILANHRETDNNEVKV